MIFNVNVNKGFPISWPKSLSQKKKKRVLTFGVNKKRFFSLLKFSSLAAAAVHGHSFCCVIRKPKSWIFSFIPQKPVKSSLFCAFLVHTRFRLCLFVGVEPQLILTVLVCWCCCSLWWIIFVVVVTSEECRTIPIYIVYENSGGWSRFWGSW